ncbi:hypothetical protein WMO79_04610 [Micrococcaceae bacterium Sec7.4]
MKTVKCLDLVIAMDLSKILVHKDVSKHVIEILRLYTTVAEFQYPMKSGDQRWHLEWSGETYDDRESSLQEAAAALEDHGYEVSLRP